MDRLSYGASPEQYAEWSPVADARGIVVVIHGGYWRARYDLSLGRPLAADLNRRGWSTLNLEYRRIGNGGGAPATFDDVAAGIDLLAELAPGHAGPVVALGHSAGGHLAVWAAARGRFGWPEQVRLTHVISQAGVLDLRAAHRDHLSSDAVTELLGPPDAADEPAPDALVIDARFDPGQQLPLDVPVTCLHAPDDDTVPISQALDYVAASRAAVARAQRAGPVPAAFMEVTGGHFDLIDPTSDAWQAVIDVLEAGPHP